MNPGVRRGLEGRRPRDAGCWPHRTICRAQDKRDPVAVPLAWLRAPGGSCGAAPSCGRDRRYRPDRPVSRVVHLHQACMDHPLEVARQRLQVDGKPHPTAPSHPQAPKPVGALELGVRSLDPGPYGIPLARLLGGLGPPAPLDVYLHQVRLEDVVPRTPVQLHWATGPQGSGLACCPGKVDLYPLRRILQLVLLDGRVVGGAHRGLLPCDVDLKVRGGGPSPSPSCEFPGADPATGLTSSVPRREASKALRPDPYAVSTKSSSGRTFRSASPSTTGTLTSVSLPLEGVTSTWVMSWVAFSSWQVSATCTSYPFPLWPL